MTAPTMEVSKLTVSLVTPATPAMRAVLRPHRWTGDSVSAMHETHT